jgi:hypothetical protein
MEQKHCRDAKNNYLKEYYSVFIYTFAPTLQQTGSLLQNQSKPIVHLLWTPQGN